MSTPSSHSLSTLKNAKRVVQRDFEKKINDENGFCKQPICRKPVYDNTQKTKKQTVQILQTVPHFEFDSITNPVCVLGTSMHVHLLDLPALAWGTAT